MKKILFIIYLVLPIFINGQSSFSLEVVPKIVSDIPAIHSFVHAEYDGKWLIIGGRVSENQIQETIPNYQLIVVDPETNEVWSSVAKELIDYINTPEHMETCFNSYYQDGEILYIIGGYGYNYFQMRYTTFSTITAINVPGVIKGIIKGEAVGQYFWQEDHKAFATNNGLLTKIGKQFYLVGTNKIQDSINEIGQLFLNQENIPEVVSFSINQYQRSFEINNLKTFEYEEFSQMYNTSTVPQIFPDQEIGATIFHNEDIEDLSKLSWINVFDIGLYENGILRISFYKTAPTQNVKREIMIEENV